MTNELDRRDYIDLHGKVIQTNFRVGSAPRFKILLGEEVLESCAGIDSSLDGEALVVAAQDARRITRVFMHNARLLRIAGGVVNLLTVAGVQKFPYESVEPGNIVVVRQPLLVDRRPYVPWEPLVIPRH